MQQTIASRLLTVYIFLSSLYIYIQKAGFLSQFNSSKLFYCTLLLQNIKKDSIEKKETKI